MATTQQPKARKVVVVLNDAEWREMAIAAAEDETTRQGWLTTVTLAALQERKRGKRP